MTKEPPEELVLGVLAHMREAVKSLTGKAGGPRDVPSNRKMIRRATRDQEASLEDWIAVIDAQLENVRPRPATWRFLTLSTITVPANWARIADAPVAPRSTGGTTSKSGAFTPRGEYTDL